MSRLLFRSTLWEAAVELFGYGLITYGISVLSSVAAFIFAGVVAVVIYGNGRRSA